MTTSTVDSPDGATVEEITDGVKQTIDAGREIVGDAELYDQIRDRVERDLDPEVNVARIKAAMLTEDLETVDVRIRAGLVTVRALTSSRIKFLKKINPNDEAFENNLVAEAFVVPAMTPAEVATWAGLHRAGDFVKVLGAVQTISGLDEDAQKSGVEEVRG